MGKPAPNDYRDDADSDDAASTSEAMPLTSYAAAEEPLLPSYDDLYEPIPISYHTAPIIHDSVVSIYGNTIFTCWPGYSRSAQDLENLILEQSNYAPTYTLRLIGTHSESRKVNNKTETTTVTDFDVKLDMTHLLMCPNPIHSTDPSPCADCHHIQLLEDGAKAYRGHVFKTTGPHHEDLTSWCEAFVSSEWPVKSFTLARRITGHKEDILNSSCTQLIRSTSYRGQVNITCEVSNREVAVYSDSEVNRMRFNKWICWFFYLTFLWIISWPILWLCTKRYAPVTAAFAYCKPNGSPLVQSERSFFDEWKVALRQAVISRHQGWVDAAYRAESLAMQRDGATAVDIDVRRAEDMVANLVRVAMADQARMGWGADS